MSTETAVLDDDGDGTPRQATGDGKDGTLASLTFMDAVVASRPADPELQQMVQRQEQLVLEVDALKKKKAQMGADDYRQAWETLIIELATVSHEVRARIK
jgi:hypothetical protein